MKSPLPKYALWYCLTWDRALIYNYDYSNTYRSESNKNQSNSRYCRLALHDFHYKLSMSDLCSLVSPYPSVCLSVCLFVRLSVPCLWTGFCDSMLLDIVTWTHYSPSEDVHLDVSYGLSNFSSFYRLFAAFALF